MVGAVTPRRAEGAGHSNDKWPLGERDEATTENTISLLKGRDLKICTRACCLVWLPYQSPRSEGSETSKEADLAHRECNVDDGRAVAGRPPGGGIASRPFG